MHGIYFLLIVFLSQSQLFTHKECPQNWRDFANITRFDKANLELKLHTKPDNRVVFMGNSITEGWVTISYKTVTQRHHDLLHDGTQL